jgi:hypothetical protein
MSTDLERRLRDAVHAPRPSREVTARARAATLAVVPAGRRGVPRLLVALAAVAVAIGLGAAALAATGKLHVAVGTKPHRAAPAPARLTVPAGTHGIALVAGERLWLVTRGGLRIEGMAVSAAELSPRALYALVGVGSSLVALAPGGRRAWVHHAPGRVVAAAWAPDGLKIAYVVRIPSGAELRLIEGDGDHDRLLDRHVAPLEPHWRPDSLGLVYERATGRGVVLDFARGVTRSHTRPAAPNSWNSATALSPDGKRVARAILGRGGVLALRVVQRVPAAPPRLLLRVRVRPGPVSISWR